MVPPHDTDATSTGLKKAYGEIEKRISQVTDSRSMPFTKTQCQTGTREIRMITAAWIMICKFDCQVYGGFVRDWIIGHKIGRPESKTVDQWILYEDAMPSLDPKVVPADIDCYLPMHGLYDVDKMIDELMNLEMSVRVYRHCSRYVLLVDQNTKTGPFMIDLIIPHTGITTYERVDCDVNNLYIEKNLTQHLGMRIDITNSPYNFSLEKIVNNIWKNRFHLLLAKDKTPAGKVIRKRVSKMKKRGWKHMHSDLPPMISSASEPSDSELKLMFPTSSAYKAIEQQIRSSFGDTQLQILLIEKIYNVELEKIYNQAKKIIEKESGITDGNETILYHGAKGK